MSVGLYVSVPVAAFRAGRAREFWETHPLPPPATVYGLLLSLVGETDRYRHVGAQVALARLSEPALSVILRSQWRIKKKEVPPGHGPNVAPDYQEVLTGVELGLWVRDGSEPGTPTLAERVAAALAAPKQVKRFGALCLGESTHLVDVVRRWQPGSDPAAGATLVSSPSGDLTLPIWVDHVGSADTRAQGYDLQDLDLAPATDRAWTTISPLA